MASLRQAVDDSDGYPNQTDVIKLSEMTQSALLDFIKSKLVTRGPMLHPGERILGITREELEVFRFTRGSTERSMLSRARNQINDALRGKGGRVGHSFEHMKEGEREKNAWVDVELIESEE